MEIKPAMVAISAFIVITVIAAVLMPVLSDATKTDDTLTNDGFYRMDKIDTSSTYSFAWDHTKPTLIVANGETVQLPKYNTTYYLTVIGTDNWMLRYVYNNGTVEMQLFDSTLTSAIFRLYSTGSDDLSIAVSSGSATMTYGTNTLTKTFTDDMLAVSADGAYVMKASSDSAYMLGDSEIFAIGRSDKCFYIVGTIDGGFTIQYYPPVSESDTITFSDPEVVKTDDDTHICYDFTGITFTMTINTTDYEQSYSQIIVPYQITAEKVNHLDSNEIVLLMSIPVLLIVAIVVGVVVLTIRGRE